MRIYKHEPLQLLRISIRKIGEEVEYLTIADASADEFESFVKGLISKEKIDPFATGHRTGIDIRNATGGKNGKTQSISFKGMTPKEVKLLIEKNIQ